jgi:hypothetical protein
MDVKVWNDNEYPFTQAFKGVDVSIAPKQFIKMERGEAVDFLGLFSSIVRDADGAPHPKSYKKLRIEEIASKDK